MRESDLTRGSVPGVLFSFALPYLLANVLQALYGGADLFVVGQYDDAASVSGVAIGSQVMQTVTGIILGLTAGITVLVGIAAGARNEREMAAVIGSSVWLFAIAGAVLTVLMTVFHSGIVSLMHTPPEAVMDAERYLLICSLGIPFIIGYNVVCGILRGMGAEYLRGYSIDCIMVSFVFCFNAHFSGQGNSLFPMLHSMIATFLFRIPLSWAFSHIGTDPLVWMGYAPPLSTLVSLVICVSYFLYRRRRRIAASV